MAKIDRLCTKLDLRPDDRVVEIGSGWGGFALHAAERYGCRVTTTTISEAQRTFVAKRVAEAGLADRVTVLGDDWRDLRGRFDKLVSVEMIEAVDWRHHDQFVAACAGLARRRRAGGRCRPSSSTIAASSGPNDTRTSFAAWCSPGGCIPSVARSRASLARSTDLRIIDLEDIGRHYAETLRRWAAESRRRTRQRSSASGREPEFRRLWALYLAYCEASFLERHVSDVQLVLAKPAWRGELQARARLMTSVPVATGAPVAGRAEAVRGGSGCRFSSSMSAALAVVVVGWSPSGLGVWPSRRTPPALSGSPPSTTGASPIGPSAVPRAVQLAGATLGAAAATAGHCGGWRTIVPTTAATDRRAIRTRRW